MDLEFIEPYEVLRVWPRETPILFLGGSERYCLLATSWEELSEPDAFALRLRPKKVPLACNPFRHGLVSLVAYRQSRELPNRHFRIKKGFGFDRVKQTAWSLGVDSQPAFSIKDLLADYSVGKNEESPESSSNSGFDLDPDESDRSFIAKIERAIQDIRRGRFYQVNLVRQFMFRREPSWSELLNHFVQKSEAMSALLSLPGDLLLASYSPERFVRITPQTQGSLIQTFPIKGTQKLTSGSIDEQVRRLRKNPKEVCELNMIVDLMRHDLQSVCRKGSVEVVDAGKVLRLDSLLHRAALISGQLKPNLKLGDIISNLCPGGSITGAPKVEAMRVIDQNESGPRGYFMGNLIYTDDTGYLDSSILIRTVVKLKNQPFRYAAGSGIVLDSQPESECEEVYTKCRVLTGNSQKSGLYDSKTGKSSWNQNQRSLVAESEMLED